MKTAIQELIEKYTDHLKHDDDLEQMSGKDILKIVLVDLISYQVKEKEQIIDAYEEGEDNIDANGCFIDKDGSEQYYNENFKQD